MLPSLPSNVKILNVAESVVGSSRVPVVANTPLTYTLIAGITNRVRASEQNTATLTVTDTLSGKTTSLRQAAYLDIDVPANASGTVTVTCPQNAYVHFGKVVRVGDGVDTDSGALLQFKADTNGLPVTVVAGTGGSSSPPGIVIPSGWGSNWLPKLAAAQAGTGSATLAFLGDSVGCGFDASALSKGAFNLVGAALRGANGSVGDGGCGMRGAGLSPQFFTAASGAAAASHYASEIYGTTSGWSATAPAGGSAGVFADGPGGVLLLSQAAGDAFSDNFRGTSLTVYVIAQTGVSQTFGVSVDGAAFTVVTVPAGSPRIFSYTINGISAGSHTLIIQVQNLGGAGGFYYCGHRAKNGAGLVVDNYSAPGTSAWLFDNLIGNQSSLSPSNGVTTSAASGSFGPAGLYSGGPALPADCVVYAMMLNDLNGGLTPDAYAHGVSLYLQAVRNGGTYNGVTYAPDGSTELLLVAQHSGKFGTAPRYGPEMVARLSNLAARFGAAFIDFNVVGRNSYAYWQSLGYWGDLGLSGGGGSDPVHLSDAGHAYEATTLLSVLQGRGGS